MTAPVPSVQGMFPARFAVISENTIGDQEVLAAVPGRKIRVLHYTLVAAAAVTVIWKSGSVAISGSMPRGADAGMAPTCEVGLFETAPGANLVLNLSGSVAVGGHLTYVLIP